MSDIITEFRNENTKDIDLLSTIDIVRKILTNRAGICYHNPNLDLANPLQSGDAKL